MTSLFSAGSPKLQDVFKRKREVRLEVDIVVAYCKLVTT
jgi:hypothetical protein